MTPNFPRSYYYSFVSLWETPNAIIEKYQLPVRYSETFLKGRKPEPITSNDLDELFLAHLLCQDITEVEDFLDYHFKKFEGSPKKIILHTAELFHNHLSKRLSIHHPGSGERLPIINDFLTETILKWIERKKENSSRGKVIPSNLKFPQIFKEISQYQYIMNILVEKGYCNPHTLIWEDQTGGSKGLLAAILKCLHTQGYYKNNQKLTSEQIKQIAGETFGLKISIDTVKKANKKNNVVDFIPVASTVK